MSDLRFDPISGRWISIAQNRNDRPIEFDSVDQRVQNLVCPFCSGRENETPDAWHSYDADGVKHDGNSCGSWLTRVVPNKYPSLTQQNVESRSNVASAPSANGSSANHTDTSMYRWCTESGTQDLIIPTPRHVISIGDLTEAELKIAFVAYQDQLILLRDNSSIKHGMLFTNCRTAAGASLEHIHTQVIGVPVISGYLQDRVNRNAEHYNQHSVSLIQSLVDWERDQGERILEETDHFTAFCPFASQYAFQVWIVPKREAGSFLTCSSAIRDELALLSRRMVNAMEQCLDEPAYNMLFQLAPFDDDSVPASDRPWYVEILPRMTTAAGFELGTDIWVNPVAPETAASHLKARLLEFSTADATIPMVE